jgi:hypothetical protein
MESIDGLAGAELSAAASIWAAQKRELVVAFGGTSMLPAIGPGQKVLLRCGVTPSIGQVAAYVRDGCMAVHRVVARGEGPPAWMMTWGDANPLPDDPLDDWRRIVGTIDRLEIGETMVDLPPPAQSVVRKIILWFVLHGGKGVSGIRARLTLLYRIRSNISIGPLPLARKLVHKVFC